MAARTHPTSAVDVSPRLAHAGLAELARGLLRHPVLITRIVLLRLRHEPLRVGQALLRTLPQPIRAAVAPVARAMVRMLRRMGLFRSFFIPYQVAAPLEEAKHAFQAGYMRRALEILTPYANHGTVRRRMELYQDEIDAYGSAPIPSAARVEIGPRVAGRVLHCVTTALPYNQAGYTVRTQCIAAAQCEAGLDPHVVTIWGWPMLQGHPQAAAYEAIDGVPYHRLLPDGDVPAGTRSRMVKGAERLVELAARLRPSVLHAATDHRNGSVALSVRDRTGIPVVYEVRGFLEETWLSRLGDAAAGCDRHVLARERETMIMRSADAVVTLAETMRQEIIARGVPADRVVLAPNAVDDSLLSRADTLDGRGFRRKYGITADEIVVGSVSSLVPYEGFATLLRAAALLRDRRMPVRVLLVGDGLARDALLAQVRELGLADLAVLPGRVSPEHALNAQAAIDIFTCPREDLRVCRLVTPLKPVEAMALGKPVVMSDLPPLAELLGSEGRAGLLIPPGDPEALAEAIAALAGDPARRAAMGEAGRAEVASSRTWGRVVETYKELYWQLT